MNSYTIPLLIAAVGGLLLSGCATGKVEEPSYLVVADSGGYEIRSYEPQLVAQTRVSGDRKAASSEGFRVLADYIFGNNQSQQKIAMTAPVSQAPENSPDTSQDESTSEKIAMTAPVSQQRDGEQWVVTFTMPAEYTLDTLPIPNNPAVVIVQSPSATFAVRSFSGYARDKKVASEKKALLKALSEDNVEPLGEVVLSQYNPPWTPGFMRRNEVMVPIKTP